MNQNQIQQGDVIFRKVKEVPATLKPATSRVIEVGEATGHAHVLEDNQASHIFGEGDNMFIVCEKATSVSHQEHNQVTLEPGTWRKSRVREWDYFKKEDEKVRD